MDADLEVFVNSPTDPLRQVVSLYVPRAIPVVDGDGVRVEAKLSQPAYAYLFWVDTEGEAIPLYPWRDFDWANRPSEQPVSEFSWPAETLTFHPLEGSAGTETICLVTRDQPLPKNVDLAKVLGGLPAQSAMSGTLVELINGKLSDVSGQRQQRGPKVRATDTTPNPVFELQSELQDVLQQHFAYIRMISFPNQGDRNFTE